MKEDSKLFVGAELEFPIVETMKMNKYRGDEKNLSNLSKLYQIEVEK